MQGSVTVAPRGCRTACRHGQPRQSKVGDAGAWAVAAPGSDPCGLGSSVSSPSALSPCTAAQGDTNTVPSSPAALQGSAQAPATPDSPRKSPPDVEIGSLRGCRCCRLGLCLCVRVEPSLPATPSPPRRDVGSSTSSCVGGLRGRGACSPPFRSLCSILASVPAVAGRPEGHRRRSAVPVS